MEDQVLKSANQLYNESGSSLPFKQWIEEQKSKGNFIFNSKLQDKISSILNSEKEPVVAKGQNAVGLDRRYLILAGVIVGGALLYQFVIKKAK
jgi:hypothetical protein